MCFTTDARLSDDGRSWTVPIHAWGDELAASRAWKAAFAGILENRYGLVATPATSPNFDRRFQLFVVDNERDECVVIRIAGSRFELPPTGPNGYSRAEIELDADRVAKRAGDGRLEYSAVLPRSDPRLFLGSVNLVAREGLSVISDIDDIVKLTEVTEPPAMLERTFFRDFEAAPGIAALYQRWARQGAAFHFVSSSPMSEPILADYPDRRFVLIGDSGEQVPEVYAALLRKHSEPIERIYIRDADDSDPADERYRAAFASVDSGRWSLFTDPAFLELPE